MKKNVTNRKAVWNAKGGKTVLDPIWVSSGQRMQRALTVVGVIVAAVLLIGAIISPLRAQSYPTKPIRFILPFPPGGSVDILGRIIGPKLMERLGQPVVCENRPGATGNIGVEFASKARPDGYTIVIGSATMTTSPSLYKKLNYDPIKDLAPISLIAQTSNLVLVRQTLPVKNLKELVEYARANPGKLSYGSSGMGGPPHLAGELLKILTKIDILHVPYRGGTPALMGLIGGELDMMVSSTPTALPHVQAGKVKALAVLTNERLPSLPDVPTAKEAGIDDWETAHWYGILAPAGTPYDILNRLSAEWIKIAAMPDTVKKMQNAGLDPLSGTPEQFSKFLKAEVERWAKVIREANIPKID